MNLSEALDAALPEIPKAQLSRTRPPRLDPELVTREDILDGEPVVVILQRSKGSFFRFQPSQWQLAQLFDGIRSYDEIAQKFTQEQGGTLSARELEEFATQPGRSRFLVQDTAGKKYGVQHPAKGGERTKSD